MTGTDFTEQNDAINANLAESKFSLGRALQLLVDAETSPVNGAPKSAILDVVFSDLQVNLFRTNYSS